MTVTLLRGDVLDVLAKLPPDCVHCVVTSPPYWGLRDYGTGAWEGGDAACDHFVGRFTTPVSEKQHSNLGSGTQQARNSCPKCGARRVDRQLGLEATPEEHVANMVEVFREVRRVLRSDGTCWLNYGDSYASGSGGDRKLGEHDETSARARPSVTGLKPKDMVGMPWRIAFALQADGWWLRSDIIWHKPNGMPESVTDRPTKAHEYVFLLTKSSKYFYDADAVRGGVSQSTLERWKGNPLRTGEPSSSHQTKGETHCGVNPAGRNLRSVWTIATAPFSEAHFATFPPKLAETCIKSGTSEKGCCPACGAPWVRVIESELVKLANRRPSRKALMDGADMADINSAGAMGFNRTTTVGFRQSCTCPPAVAVPCTVLDPFAGAGTTLMVADRLQRHAIGIELSDTYADMAERRLSKDRGGLLEAML